MLLQDYFLYLPLKPFGAEIVVVGPGKEDLSLLPDGVVAALVDVSPPQAGHIAITGWQQQGPGALKDRRFVIVRRRDGKDRGHVHAADGGVVEHLGHSSLKILVWRTARTIVCNFRCNPHKIPQA